MKVPHIPSALAPPVRTLSARVIDRDIKRLARARAEMLPCLKKLYVDWAKATHGRQASGDDITLADPVHLQQIDPLITGIGPLNREPLPSELRQPHEKTP